MQQIKRALISVYDKAGIVDFAKGLDSLGIEILSTGGTARCLKDAGIRVRDVSDYTQFPEMMDGRVKTLHPKIHGGLLCLRGNKSHMALAKKNEIEMIDLVVVNLYPFEDTVRKNLTAGETIEMIDIGGPSMLRSAAKNFLDVLVVTEPADYSWLLGLIKKGDSIGQEERKKLAFKAFARTSAYDFAISCYLSEKTTEFPATLSMQFKKKQDMRYGENPHQSAAFYVDPMAKEPGIGDAEQILGKELSYNNIMDADAALEIVKEFSEPCAVVIKHANPSGVAAGDSINDALEKAYNADPLSAYGCVIALNRQCNAKCAHFLKEKFIEVVVAPDFDSEAIEILKEKGNRRLLRLVQLKDFYKSHDRDMLTAKKVVGGLLVQSRNFPDFDIDKVKTVKNPSPTKEDIARLVEQAKSGTLNEVFCVTKKTPTHDELKDMLFAMKVCKHVKSNSVIYVKGSATIGIGAGQMSRVDSAIIATRKSDGRSQGAVMASDAFFPFRDGIDEAAKAGISSVVQPGGSIRDKEVIQAADEHGMAMIFTGVRLFLH